MLKSSLFYMKVSLKSIYFVVAMIVTFLEVFVRYIDLLDDSFFLYTRNFLIPFIFFHLYLIITSATMMYQEHHALSFLEKDRGKKMIAIVLANLFVTIGFGVLNVLIMLIFKNPLFSATTIYMGIGDFFILLFTGSFFAITLGICVAAFMKNELSIFVSLAIYGIMIAITFGAPSNNLLINYLQVFLADDTFVLFNDMAGVLWTKEYVVDKLAPICFSLFLLSFTYLLLTFKKRKRDVIVPICTIIAFSYLMSYGFTHEYDFYHPVAVDQKLFEDYTIEKYEMQLNLHNQLENKVRIKISFEKDSEQLPLLFDSIFTVESVKVNNEMVEYTFADNMLVLHNDFVKNETALVEIGYKGAVDVKSDLGMNLFYVSPFAVNLVGGEFFWYPTTLGNDVVDFHVDVAFDRELYSNLQFSNGTLQGSAHQVSIFAGHYFEHTDDGVRYIYPTTMSVESIKHMITDIIKNDEEPKEIMEILKKKQYDQVIVGAWSFEGDLLKVENSTLLIKLR